MSRSLPFLRLSRALRIPSPQTRQIRFNSSTTAKPVSPHIGFYKTFTRPIAKVLLMATFTYQVAYWGWVKLEKDEVKAERNAEIKELESELQNLIKMAEDAGIKVKS